MPIPFAALEARVNEAVFAHLSDAEGTVAGMAATGLFTEAWDPAQAGAMLMGGTRPAWTVPQAALPLDWEHAPAIITAGNGIGAYRIVEVHPLDAGVVTLVLERVLS